jgi:NAD(P)-dependent dehydrogenase (short-subunit alcohol dehydrogenase family)
MVTQEPEGGGLLAGKVTMISGVGPGLGATLARRVAAHGSDLVLVARRAAEFDLPADVRSRTDALAVATDITDAAACRHAVAAALERFGRLDVVVNNAYQPDRFQPFADADLDVWRDVMDVNAFGSLRLTRAALDAMPESGGAIVMVGSMIVRTSPPAMGGYTMSKAALQSAARTLARELGPRGIRVNTVVPGWIWGASVRGYFESIATAGGPSVDEQYAAIASRAALGFVATEDHVADTCAFLASDLAAAITGQEIEVHAGDTTGM